MLTADMNFASMKNGIYKNSKTLLIVIISHFTSRQLAYFHVCNMSELNVL